MHSIMHIYARQKGHLTRSVKRVKKLSMKSHRLENEPEMSEPWHAFRSVCRYCKEGIVMMLRHPKTFKLTPDLCYCINCGQRYFVEILDIHKWEQEQFQQKMEKLRND
jgi:hypothetical protein